MDARMTYLVTVIFYLILEKHVGSVINLGYALENTTHIGNSLAGIVHTNFLHLRRVLLQFLTRKD